MKFNSDGYLDAGLHPTTLEEMKEYLVEAFAESEKRPTVFAGYERHTSELQTIPMVFEQLIGGSFVSLKEDPSDIDLLGIGQQAEIDALPLAEQSRITELFKGPDSKKDYECDAYFLPSFPETDPAFPYFRVQRKYWLGEFGYDRLDKPKGILTVKVVPGLSDSSSTLPHSTDAP